MIFKFFLPELFQFIVAEFCGKARNTRCRQRLLTDRIQPQHVRVIRPVDQSVFSNSAARRIIHTASAALPQITEWAFLPEAFVPDTGDECGRRKFFQKLIMLLQITFFVKQSLQMFNVAVETGIFILRPTEKRRIIRNVDPQWNNISRFERT